MQKEKLKTQKGITLIALIITIIVMLILVGVTVTVALQGGLFNTAKDAAQKTAEAVKQETDMLRYEYEIASAKGETTASFDEWVLDTKYGIKIWDKVNYKEGTGHTSFPDITKGAGTSYDYTNKTLVVDENGYTNEDLEWRVLGVTDSGQIELISTNPTEAIVYVAGEVGYLNAETVNENIGTLDKICNDLYGQGAGAITSRSLNIDDIHKLANYDTAQYESGKVWKYRFSNTTGKIQYSTDNGVTWRDSFNCTIFKAPGEEEINETNTRANNPLELKDTAYTYKLSNKITTSIENGTIQLSDFIDSGEDAQYGISSQLLASTYVHCDVGYAYFDICSVDSDGSLNYGASVYQYNMLVSNRDPAVNCSSGRLRPVVTLSANIEITGQDDNGVWQIQ